MPEKPVSFSKNEWGIKESCIHRPASVLSVWLEIDFLNVEQWVYALL